MARYTNDNVRNDTDFLNFIKNEYGYDSTEAIPAFEYNAILYRFKAKENDFDDEDFAALEAYADNEKLQDIVDIYYPEKTVKDLSMEDTAFVQAIARETANNPDVSLDIIRESRRQKKMRAIDESINESAPQQLDAIKDGKNVTLIVDDSEFSKAQISYYGKDNGDKDLIKIELFDLESKNIGYAIMPFTGGESFGEINGHKFEVRSPDEKQTTFKLDNIQKNLTNTSLGNMVGLIDDAFKEESREIQEVAHYVAMAERATSLAAFNFWRDDFRELKHYSKEELDGIMKAHEVYLQAPDEVQNHETLKAMDANYESTHGDLFVETVETAEKDIAAYADGTLTIDADAYDSMEQYISTFGRGTRKDANGEFIYTPTALKALERLKTDREKAPAQRTVSGADKEATLAGIVSGLQRNAQEREKQQNRGAAGIIINETAEKELQKDERKSGIDKLQQNEGENARIRSDHNLSNEQKLAAVRLLVMSNMEVISAEDYQKYSTDIRSEDIQKAQEAFEFVDNAEEKVKKPEEYKNQMVDVLLNRDLAELMTPEMTTVAYDNLQKRIAEAEKQAKKEKSDEADQNVAALNTKLEDVLSRMDSLQGDFKNKRGFYLLDITNAADAYDGYMHMFDVRQKDLDAKNKALEQDKKELDAEADKERIAEIDKEMAANEAVKNEYGQSQQDIDEIIATYDERWNIPNGKNPRDTAISFNDRIKTGSKILDELKFDEETLGSELLTEVSKFKFNDKDGKPIPQFIDPKNPETKSDVWREGLEVDPNGQLATVLKLAGNDSLMENLGSKEKITKEKMVEELKSNVPFKLFEIYNAEETIRGAVEDPEKFTTKKEQYLAEFQAKLNNPEIPLGISPEGYNAAIDDQVNKVEVYANRLDRKLGKANTEFTKAVLFEQVQKIDRQAPNRGKKSKDIKKGAMKRALWGVAMGGTMAYVGSRLVTNAVATGGISVIGSSALALGTAVTVGAAATAMQIWSRKKAAKKRGEKYGWKEFKKDKMLHASILTTTLACASAAFAMSNAPELSIPAAACAIGSFGMGAGLRFAQPYREMRLKGHGKVAAFALGAANAAAVFAGGYLGRQHGLGDITPTQHEEITGYKDVKVGEVKTYSEDQIAKVTERNNTDSMWEYRGEGPHDIPAYRNPDNYSNEAWWTPEQHDKAIAALKEQMPKLGWKEGVGNEEVMLRKLASFERLHRNSDFVLPDGQTVGEKFGDYKALLDGLLEGKLTPEGAKQLDVIQYNVGENGHSKILDSLGGELYSYQDHPHGIHSEDVMDKVPVKTMVDDKVNAPGGGVFGWVVSSWNKLKDKIRPGTKADKVEKKEKPKPEPEKPIIPVIVPEKPKPEPEKPVVVPVQQEEKPNNLMLDEYKIVYGIEPETTPGKDKAWKEYCQRVEEERKAAAPDKDMNTFLLDRRQKLDETIMNNVVSENDVTEAGKPIRSDYMVKKAKDDRGKAGVVMEARQNLMQSNLTKDNFLHKITLSHFTKFMEHFVKHDEVVADGSRNIALNPKLKDKYKKEGSKVAIVDLNQYLVEDKPLDTAKQKVSGKDARQAMTDLKKTYER